MRRYLKIFLIFVLAVCFTVVPPEVINASSDINVLLEGEELSFDVPPQIIEGRTLLPLRAIFEALGLEVGWDDVTRVITGTAAGKEIILKLDSKDAVVNGVDKILDVPAKAINGRTLVPVRFIAESLDMKVLRPIKNMKKKYVNGVETNETRYNGKNHVFGPETRVLSDFNKQVKFYIDNENYLDFRYDKNRIGVEYKTTYYDIDPILGSLYYNFKDKTIRVDERNIIYTNECNVMPCDNEIYLGSVIKELNCYGTNEDAFFKKNAKIVKNPNYSIDLNYARNDDVLLQKLLAEKEKGDLVFATNLKKELESNKNTPIKILKTSISYNSTGTPEVTLEIKNLSDKTVKAYEIILYCYDDFNRPVGPAGLLNNGEPYSSYW